MGIKTAAAIIDGVVVNVSVFDPEKSQEWLEHVRGGFDDIIIVDEAAIGWVQYEPEKIRPPQPYPSWAWDGTGWQPPTPMPVDGQFYTWDENGQTWIKATPEPIGEQGDLNGTS